LPQAFEVVFVDRFDKRLETTLRDTQPELCKDAIVTQLSGRITELEGQVASLRKALEESVEQHKRLSEPLPVAATNQRASYGQRGVSGERSSNVVPLPRQQPEGDPFYASLFEANASLSRQPPHRDVYKRGWAEY
jgi:hypothetical protein